MTVSIGDDVVVAPVVEKGAVDEESTCQVAVG